MAFFPAHCDLKCMGCDKNKCGWCTWMDRATPYYKTEAFEAKATKVEPVLNGSRASDILMHNK